ncbi:MAG: DNA replication/repair protein RecF [Eubacteriaceae bacterium]
MFIEELHLIHYRNYKDEKISFKNGINLIVGENAQGKTNLVEAMFFLSRGYSHRASNNSELMGWEENHFFINAQVISGGVRHQIKVINDHGKKQLLLDEKPRKREKILGIFNTILFEPDDLKIVKEGPDKRRRFLNQEISGFKPEYHYLIRDYEKALNQRNALLKEIRMFPSLELTLDSWDEQLILIGAKLMKHRIHYLHRLNKEANLLHRELSSEREKLALYYQNNLISKLTDVKELELIFRQKLKENRKEDIKKGSTTYGPHVDDILIEINGKDARRYGSQGQQRSAAISLKLSQIKIVYENTKEYPIVLLDDIFSELDENRCQSILGILKNTQTFITCTEEGLIKGEFPNKNIIRIKKGRMVE